MNTQVEFDVLIGNWLFIMCSVQHSQQGGEEKGSDRQDGAGSACEGGPQDSGSGHIQDQLHGPAHHSRMVQAQ